MKGKRKGKEESIVKNEEEVRKKKGKHEMGTGKDKKKRG